MPIIVPEVNSQPLPNVREQANTSPTTFGGGAGLEAVGHETQRLTENIGNIVAYEKVRADQTAVQDATAKLSEASTKLLYDPNTGVMASKGVNAMGAHDAAWEQYRQTANTISDGLTSPEARGAFNKVSLTMGDSFNRSSMAHVSQQLQEHDVQSFDALTKNVTEQGALSYGDNIHRSALLGILNDNTVQFAKRNGMDADQTQALLLKNNGNFHAGVIDRMTSDGQTDLAKQYFDQYKEQIPTTQATQIARVLGEGSVRSESNTQAQSIMSSHADSESDALEAAGKIKNPDVQEMTKQIVSRNFQQMRQAQRNDEDSTFVAVGKRISQAGLSDPIDIRKAVTPAEWEGMREGQRTALLKSGEETVTSPKKWLDFMEQLKNGEISNMSRADFSEKYLPYFDTADKKRAEDLWITGKKGPGSSRLMTDENTAKAIETSLVNAGLVRADTKRRGDDQKKLIYQFDGDIHRDILQYESSQKKSPSPDDVQKIIDSRTKQYFADSVVKTPGKFWDSQKPIALMTDKEKGDSYVPVSKIPQRDVATLEDLMRKAGRPVTKEKTQRAYAAYVTGDRKRLRDVIQE